MNNLELFNKFWKELNQYKADENALGHFVELLIKNKTNLAKYKRKIVLFLKKIDYYEILDNSGRIGEGKLGVDRVTCCWLWNATKDKYGYGKFCITNNPHKTVPSSRFMLFLVNLDFDLDSELEACHKCDNTNCNNPNHLWLGTHQDNMTDRNNKNRTATGINASNSILTDEQVLAIFNDPRVQSIIATEYGVANGTISNIKKGDRQLTDKSKSLPKNQNIRSLQGNTGSAKLTKENVIEILKLYATGQYYQKELAIKFGIAQSAISRIINGKTLKRFGI